MAHSVEVSQKGASDAFKPELSDLSRLKLQVARHSSRTVQIDMAGYAAIADFASLVFAGQELLGHAVDGLTAAYNLTNTTPKWRTRLLEQLPGHWAHSLFLRISEPAPLVYWTLHRAPDKPAKASALRHAHEIVTFTRTIFAWAEDSLLAVRHDGPMGAPAASEIADPGFVLPKLKLDVDFAYHHEGVRMGRLNAAGHSIDMSTSEFRIALRFDGHTTAAEAETAVCGVATDGALAQGLASRIAEAGFCTID